MGELIFVVPASFDGCAVSDFLRRGKGVSYRLMKTLKRMDPPWGLLRDEMLIRTIDTVRAGDRIVLRWPEQEAASVPLAEQVPVLYEDASLVVFNKPWNMPCHPVRKHQDDTLGNVFAARCAAQGQTLPFRPVNRLDKDTTGIVVAAKDPYAASKLAGNVEKEYLAILCGCPDEKSGTIDAPIRRVDPVHILREVSPDGQRPCAPLAGNGPYPSDSGAYVLSGIPAGGRRLVRRRQPYHRPAGAALFQVPLFASN